MLSDNAGCNDAINHSANCVLWASLGYCTTGKISIIFLQIIERIAVPFGSRNFSLQFATYLRTLLHGQTPVQKPKTVLNAVIQRTLKFHHFWTFQSSTIWRSFISHYDLFRILLLFSARQIINKWTCCPDKVVTIWDCWVLSVSGFDLIWFETFSNR